MTTPFEKQQQPEKELLRAPSVTSPSLSLLGPAMTAQAEQLLQRAPSVASSLVPAIFNIFSRWRLTSAQQMTLLGLSKKTLDNWKKQPEKTKLTLDLLERASYILEIYKSLQMLLPDQALADRWLATPNDNPLFNGTAPLECLLDKQVAGLVVIRSFLDAEQGGW